MTNPLTPEEIDERRAEALARANRLDWEPESEVQRQIPEYMEMAHAIRQSDEERGFKLIDTREYAAVRRETLRAWILDISGGYVPTEIAAILAAQENDNG